MKKYYIGFLSLLIIPSFAFASVDANLQYGSRGPEVVKLQEFLISTNFLKGKSTGNFYSATKNAVISYQKTIKVRSDGFVGPLTRTQINATLAKVNKPIVSTPVITLPVAPQQQNTPTVQQSQPIVQNPIITTSASVSTPSNTPTPTTISIQNSVCNLAQSNFKTEYNLNELLANGNTDGRIWMDAYILDQNGQNYYNTNPTGTMTITTSDHSNDKTLNGSGDLGQCGYQYSYQFYTTKTGTYSVTYSILNLAKTITITVK